jgi:hypothetical protein
LWLLFSMSLLLQLLVLQLSDVLLLHGLRENEVQVGLVGPTKWMIRVRRGDAADFSHREQWARDDCGAETD